MANATITISKTIAHNIDLNAPGKYDYTTGVTITNHGAIAPSGSRYIYDMGGITGGGDTIVNNGTILGTDAGAYPLAGIYLSFASAQNILVNNGVVRDGVVLKGGTFTNYGTVSSGVYFAGTLINRGLITNVSGRAGGDVSSYGDSTIINSGTINGGGGSAIDLGGDGLLVVAPGAVFIGAVDAGATDVLQVEGSSAIALAGVGTSFENFGTISFAPGAAWTIAGDAAGLAAGQTIAGFGEGDAIELTGFAATGETFVGGVGLVLSNGTALETLNIAGSFSTGGFTLTNYGYTTRIVGTTVTPSTISTTVTVGVTLGADGYDSPLTITGTGKIAPAAGGTDGVYAAAGTVVNQGSIAGGAGAASAGAPQAGGVGVALANATLTNTGFVTGGQGGAGSPGGGNGGNGIYLHGGALANSGTVIGGAGATGAGNGGSGGYGLYIYGGAALNSGTIIGGAGGAAMNGQTGLPAGAGVLQKSGVLTNTGTIIGGVSDTALEPGASGDGLIMSGGSAENRGLISGGAIDNVDQGGGAGLFLLGGTLTNDGRIQGAASSYTGGLAVHVIDGELLNQADGNITGGAGMRGGGGVEVTGGGLVENYGAISGGAGPMGGYGVLLLAGSLMNAGVVADGLIVSGYLMEQGGSATNAGSVAGGAFLSAGGLTNMAGGIIEGGNGIDVSGGIADNAGTIIGTNGVGAYLSGGTLINSGAITTSIGGDGVNANGGDLINSGTIIGGASNGGSAATVPGGAGVDATFLAVSNTGTIIGGSGGVYNNGGGGLILTASTGFNSGLIQGGFGSAGGSAVYLYAATFTNVGTLEAGSGAVDGAALRFGERASTLIADPGAVFDGIVTASPDVANALQLGAGASGMVGTLDMGGSFSGFATILFDVGTPWSLSGTAAELAAGAKIAGFTTPDEILLEGFSATSNTYVQGAGLELANGSVTETLDLIGAFSTSSFLVTDTAAGTKVQLCYLAGTRILTPAGERAIETLAIGDALITRHNGYRKIKWIGRQSFGRRFVEHNRDQVPVRILAGALGPNTPRRDLFVSPGHSMLLGGALVLARDLVNGVTIRQDECPQVVHYFQIEFETHDCVLAEGVWSESFCDYAGLRNQFHNVADFHRLYPSHVTPREHLLCAPRPQAGPALEAALRPVVARAAALTRFGHLQGCIDTMSPRITGWAQDTSTPELPILLEILAGNRVLGTILACDYRTDLAAAKIGRGRCAFTFPSPKMSRSGLSNLRVRRAADGAALPASQRRRGKRA